MSKKHSSQKVKVKNSTRVDWRSCESLNKQNDTKIHYET